MTEKSLKMKRITTADLIVNGFHTPIESIELDSTDMSEEDLLKELSDRFCKMFVIRFDEKWVKK